MISRRSFVISSAAAGPFAVPFALPAASPAGGAPTETIDLCGQWRFRTDPQGAGEKENWPRARLGGGAACRVPHTWQIEEPLTEYRGQAWYQRDFDVQPEWRDNAVRIEFEAVFHSARVWINGEFAGEHLRKGYTAFTFDVSPFLRWDRPNTLTVRVDNSFDEHMLPRGRSSDWAHDGGIFRPVSLLVTPKVFIERIAIDAQPDLVSGTAGVEIAAYIRNTGAQAAKGTCSLRIVDEDTGLTVLAQQAAGSYAIDRGATAAAPLKASLPNARIWHFDRPHLYRAEVTASGAHQCSSPFGVRRLEVRDGAFYFNDERVTLMGVERMAGSHPDFGMAEPDSWIRHDHDDLKNLNCTFTRVHWQQDRRVLDYCDRHGIMIQTEVPTWGPNTFKNMGPQCDQDIMQNGWEQLREMVARDGNHPSIVSWGLCNEIGGQNPPAFDFAKKMLIEAKRIDPHRLCSYASHSLFQTPGKDVARLMDFVEFNEYYGSWQAGGPKELSDTLDQIHAEIPGKPIVISEYGYCACTTDRPEGDQRRGEVLLSHDAVFRQKPYIGGLIFFCYNDYRTHIGDRGSGAARQRVHGVVDVYGNRKPSYEALRAESSPVEELRVEGRPKDLSATIRCRKTIPAHRIGGYILRAVCFGQGGIPVERKEVTIPDLAPGESATLRFSFQEAAPLSVQFDVMRPTGFSAYTLEWKL